jgi:hypothetical protein
MTVVLGTEMLLLLVIACIGCSSSPASYCAASLDAGCAVNEHCVCMAGWVGVDEVTYPRCMPADGGDDPRVDLTGGQAICELCSMASYCGTGRWDVAQCACVAQ